MGRGFEWLTGGRRIENYELLVEHAKKWGVDIAKIDLYLQAFKYGMPPEGGFAFGAERITQGILKLPNIREAAPFPRDMERIDIRLSKVRDSNKASQLPDVYNKIVKELEENDIDLKRYEHKPVYTSEESAKVRGTDIHQGAKALVLQADDDFVLYVLPADLQADLEKLQSYLKVSAAMTRRAGRRSWAWAMVEQLIGEYEEAIAFYQATLQEWGSATAEDRAWAMLKLGQVWDKRGDLHEAETWLQQALRQLEQVRIPALDLRGQVYSELGWLSLRHGDLAAAQRWLERGLDLVRDTQFYSVRSSILNRLGGIYFNLGQRQQAVTCVEQALKLREQLGDMVGSGKNNKAKSTAVTA